MIENTTVIAKINWPSTAEFSESLATGNPIKIIEAPPDGKCISWEWTQEYCYSFYIIDDILSKEK